MVPDRKGNIKPIEKDEAQTSELPKTKEPSHRMSMYKGVKVDYGKDMGTELKTNPQVTRTKRGE